MIDDTITRRATLSGLVTAAAGSSVAAADARLQPSAAAPSAEITAEMYGAAGSGKGSDAASLQAAIDAAGTGAVAGVGARSRVKLRPGRQYVLDANVSLRRVALDASGAHFLLKNNAGFLVGADCGFISDGNTLIQCESGYAGTVFKRDPAEPGTVRFNMAGTTIIIRLGSPDRTRGIGIDFTGFHRSKVDVEVRNMLYGAYTHPTAANLQTYYNRLDVRVQQVGIGLFFRTTTFQLCNGNTAWLSAATVENVLKFWAEGPSAGPSANTVILSYGENFSDAGIVLDGNVRHNTVIGGILEAGRGNNAPCIRVMNGAAYNKILTTCAPSSRNNALEQVGAGMNDYDLGAYGTYLRWDRDIGPGQAITSVRDAGLHIGHSDKGAPLVHNSARSAVVDLTHGHEIVRILGRGKITHIKPPTSSNAQEVTLIGSGATLVHQAGGDGQLKLMDDASIVVPEGKTITFIRAEAVSQAWIEKCRGF